MSWVTLLSTFSARKVARTGGPDTAAKFPCKHPVRLCMCNEGGDSNTYFIATCVR